MWHRQAFVPFKNNQCASRPCLAPNIWFLSMESWSWPLLALLCIMEMAHIGVCVLKVATYHVCITTPSQSPCSLHIQHSCQEEYRYLAKLSYCYWILCISTSWWSCTHWWRQCYRCTWAHQLCMWDLASFGNRRTVEQDSRGDTGAISCTDTLHPSVKR